MREAGTAFAVAPDGWLATAGHVAAPEEAAIARIAYQEKLIAEDRPHGDIVVSNLLKSVGPLHADSHVIVAARALGRPGRRVPAGAAYRVLGDVVRSDAADVALIRIGAPAAPTLALDEAAGLGTPVVTVGFGSARGVRGPPPAASSSRSCGAARWRGTAPPRSRRPCPRAR